MCYRPLCVIALTIKDEENQLLEIQFKDIGFSDLKHVEKTIVNGKRTCQINIVLLRSDAAYILDHN